MLPAPLPTHARSCRPHCLLMHAHLNPATCPQPVFQGRPLGMPVHHSAACCSPVHAASQVTVPTNWECQGFGRPQYTNFVYPFPGRQGQGCLVLTSVLLCFAMGMCLLAAAWVVPTFMGSRSQAGRGRGVSCRLMACFGLCLIVAG